MNHAIPRNLFFLFAAIQEIEITVRRRKTDPGLTMAAGSSPPRVEKVSHSSYMLGHLFVGDLILQVNGLVCFFNYPELNLKYNPSF